MALGTAPRRNRRRRDPGMGLGAFGAWGAADLFARMRFGALGIIALAVLIAVGMGLYQGWQIVRMSPRLAVGQIDVLGLERATRTEILAHAKINAGVPIFGLDLDRIALDVRRHPWVDQVTVRRRLPDCIVIEVKEHQPAMYVSMGELYLASPMGRLFRKFTVTDGIVLPILTGLTPSDAQHDAQGMEGRIRDGIGLYHALQREELLWGTVSELHWDTALGWSVVTERKHAGVSGAVRVHLGHAPLTRIALGSRALERLQHSARVPEVIWVDGEKNPERVHVRLAITGT